MSVTSVVAPPGAAAAPPAAAKPPEAMAARTQALLTAPILPTLLRLGTPNINLAPHMTLRQLQGPVRWVPTQQLTLSRSKSKEQGEAHDRQRSIQLLARA